jgi:hypothetical protein
MGVHQLEVGTRYYLKFLVYSLFSFTHSKAQSSRKKFFVYNISERYIYDFEVVIRKFLRNSAKLCLYTVLKFVFVEGS